MKRLLTFGNASVLSLRFRPLPTIAALCLMACFASDASACHRRPLAFGNARESSRNIRPLRNLGNRVTHSVRCNQPVRSTFRRVGGRLERGVLSGPVSHAIFFSWH